MPIYITENGMADWNGTLNDYHRINYYRTFINAALKGRHTINNAAFYME